MTERDGIIADAWNDYISDKNERDWKVSLRINVDLYIKGDKDISEEELLKEAVNRLNDYWEFDESEVEITDAYTF